MCIGDLILNYHPLNFGDTHLLFLTPGILPIPEPAFTKLLSTCLTASSHPHLMCPPTSIHINITGRANPGPHQNLGTTMSGDSLLSTLRKGWKLPDIQIPWLDFSTKGSTAPPKPLLLLSIIGQATTNGARSPWSHSLAFYSTGNSQCISYYISWDSYLRTRCIPQLVRCHARIYNPRHSFCHNRLSRDKPSD